MCSFQCPSILVKGHPFLRGIPFLFLSGCFYTGLGLTLLKKELIPSQDWNWLAIEISGFLWQSDHSTYGLAIWYVGFSYVRFVHNYGNEEQTDPQSFHMPLWDLVHEDMMEIYKIMQWMERVDKENFLSFSQNNRTQRPPMKLMGSRLRMDKRTYSFRQRVIKCSRMQ